MRAERSLTRSRCSTVGGSPSALRKSMAGEERNQLEHQDEDD